MSVLSQLDWIQSAIDWTIGDMIHSHLDLLVPDRVMAALAYECVRHEIAELDLNVGHRGMSKYGIRQAECPKNYRVSTKKYPQRWERMHHAASKRNLETYQNDFVEVGDGKAISG
jgi:hypothetical protein